MKTIALFAGSFNPFHVGHFNILTKGERVFGIGNVVVCFGVNADKINSDQKESYQKELESKCSDLSKKIGKIVEYYTGFLHDYVKSWEDKGYNVVVIRGLRNGDDLNYEVNQLRYISDFKPDMNTIFITCDKEYEHISSSAIRKIEQYGGPESVKKYLEW